MEHTKNIIICRECETIDCRDHSHYYHAYQCTICLFAHKSVVKALNCCKSLLHTEPLPSSCFAKEKKSKWIPKPDNESVYAEKD